MGPLIADWPNIALSLASDTKQTDSISLSYNFTLDEQLLKDETSFKFPCWPLTAVLTRRAWSGCSAGWWPSWCRWSQCPRTECSSTGPSVLVISEISWGRKIIYHFCCKSKRLMVTWQKWLRGWKWRRGRGCRGRRRSPPRPPSRPRSLRPLEAEAEARPPHRCGQPFVWKGNNCFEFFLYLVTLELDNSHLKLLKHSHFPVSLSSESWIIELDYLQPIRGNSALPWPMRRRIISRGEWYLHDSHSHLFARSQCSVKCNASGYSSRNQDFLIVSRAVRVK